MLQLVFMLLFWLPKKTFPVSEKKGQICIFIPAHNEGDVIYDTVKRLYELQKYPKELFDVYVVAHNCSDDTAEKAREAGATVFVLDDPDTSRHIASYALKYGYEQILASGEEYDFVIRNRPSLRKRAEYDAKSIYEDLRTLLYFRQQILIARQRENTHRRSRQRSRKYGGF